MKLNLSRIVQLIGRTNQFNITTRRQMLADVRGSWTTTGS